MKQRTHKLLALLLTLVMALSTVVPTWADGVEPIAYEGDTVQIIKADGSPMGMMKPDTGTTAAINGDNVVIHYVPSRQTFTGLYWGGLEDENKQADVTMGDDKAFDITLPKSVCGTGVPVVPLKADGTPAGDQYYLAVPAEDKLSGGETPADPDPAPVAEPEVEDRVDLEIINNTGMFKALFAYTGKLSGKNVLVVALTGSTYRYLYKGNYAQAVANGDKRENWIAGAQNADGKWVFTIPLEEGETYIPAVSISNTYLEKYEKGENSLERAFYPRQFQLDLTAKTLTVGDYDETLTVSVKSELETFQVADTASMQVVGGPNSNNFRVSPVLQMLDDTYDQITYPTVAEGKLTTASAALSADKTFTIDMLNAPNLFAFRDKEPIELQLREKATGATVTAAMTVDLLAQTITITGAEAKAVYVIVGQVPGWAAGSGQDLTITATRQGDDENTFAHFTGVEVDGKALDKTDYDAKSGSVVVTIRAAYLQTLAAGAHEVTFLFDDGAVTAQLTVEGATSPATGDTGAWGVLAVLSGLAAAAFLSLRRRAA